MTRSQVPIQLHPRAAPSYVNHTLTIHRIGRGPTPCPRLAPRAVRDAIGGQCSYPAISTYDGSYVMHPYRCPLQNRATLCASDPVRAPASRRSEGPISRPCRAEIDPTCRTYGQCLLYAQGIWGEKGNTQSDMWPTSQLLQYALRSLYGTAIPCRPMTFLSIYEAVVVLHTRAAQTTRGGLCIRNN